MVVARVGIAATGVVVAISLLIVAVMAVAPDARSASSVETAPDARSASSVETAQAEPVLQASTPPRPVAPERAPKAEAATANLEPKIAEGRRDLAESMFAVREGPEVTVHFDTDALRTRYDWKFERVVRSTLPILFGSVVRAALDSIPEGQLAAGGDLLTELTTRGIELPISEGQTLRVWPVTRPGQDGPLVVAYRASSAP